MTDEEMAEEWLDERYLKDMGVRKPCKQAYFAGLKAGRPKWHDLRKDPNDLPKGHLVVLNQVGARTTYDPNRGFLGFEGVGIKAWCEIPLFKEG